VTFEEMQAALRDRLRALPPAARAELVHVLRLPDFDRAERIGEFWGHPETRTFGELLIDLEGDKAARAVVFGLLRDMERLAVLEAGARVWLPGHSPVSGGIGQLEHQRKILASVPKPAVRHRAALQGSELHAPRSLFRHGDGLRRPGKLAT
jgi:hypothetical protein